MRRTLTDQIERVFDADTASVTFPPIDQLNLDANVVDMVMVQYVPLRMNCVVPSAFDPFSECAIVNKYSVCGHF